MKLVSFNQGHIGIVDGDMVVDVTEMGGVQPEAWPPVGMVTFIAGFPHHHRLIEVALKEGKRVPFSSVRLDAPIQWPNKVVAFPANYHAHVEEQKTSKVGLISTFKADGQGFFLKSNSSISGPNEPIMLPAVANREIHHESELAVIIGKGGRDISRDEAMSHVFGYSCLLDMVVRGREERVMRKSYDTFCPLGPQIVTSDEIVDPGAIEMELRVNGEIRQRATTRDLIVDIPAMIEMASAVMTLYPGDIIASGTPAGVGPVVGGDKVSIAIAGVGTMTLDVVQGSSGDHPVWNKPVE
jgi:2-keto-4-pentenoate hydratase/2-oxohepta-3-ene-1,7-dioic acid hydratase in catechol pathway|tara:strand:- start:32639 stop:33529 length:891 start_codon:yes stop_codon:yes gene_type:complete